MDLASLRLVDDHDFNNMRRELLDPDKLNVSLFLVLGPLTTSVDILPRKAEHP
jgi:hypothetical protein